MTSHLPMHYTEVFILNTINERSSFGFIIKNTKHDTLYSLKSTEFRRKIQIISNSPATPPLIFFIKSYLFQIPPVILISKIKVHEN